MAVLKDLVAQNKALIERIAALEAASKTDSKATKIEVQIYNGYPMLAFTGDFKPFSVSFGKAKRVIEHAKEVTDIMTVWHKANPKTPK